MTNIITDISTLTTLPEKTLAKLFRKMVYCMCEAVQEDALANADDNNISELDIGIGTLYIKRDPNDPKYHFVPNAMLDKAMKQTIANKENLFEDLINDALAKRFMEVYKDLCE